MSDAIEFVLRATQLIWVLGFFYFWVRLLRKSKPKSFREFALGCIASAFWPLRLVYPDSTPKA